MSRFRPEKKAKKGGSFDGPPPWLGYQDAMILSFKDRSSDFSASWAEVFMDIEFKTKGSEYPVTMSIVGEHERDDDGYIADSPVLKKIYSIADAVGFGGGPDNTGEWVNTVGDKISNVEKFMNDNYTSDPNSSEYPYRIYVYKKWNNKQNRAFTTVVPRVAKVTDTKSVGQLESYVDWAKENKNLVEYTEPKEKDPWDEKPRKDNPITVESKGATDGPTQPAPNSPTYNPG